MSEKQRPLESLSMAKHCRHHNVLPGKLMSANGGHVCALGIDILALVGGRQFGWARRIPCFLPNATEPDHVPCDKVERHTIAELEAHRDELERGATAMVKKMNVIAEVKRTKRGGEFPCPSCGGTLTISIASNGHTMGRCTGKECSSWIE